MNQVYENLFQLQVGRQAGQPVWSQPPAGVQRAGPPHLLGPLWPLLWAPPQLEGHKRIFRPLRAAPRPRGWF